VFEHGDDIVFRTLREARDRRDQQYGKDSHLQKIDGLWAILYCALIAPY